MSGYINNAAGMVLAHVYGEPCPLAAGEVFVPCDDPGAVAIGQPAPDPLIADAAAALARSDMVAMRCVKANVAFPLAWQSYVAELRAILRGASAGPLPPPPAYPEGT